MRILMLVVAMFLSCGAPDCPVAPVCHPGNYKIVKDRYQLCNELGQWEDAGEAP
jgi:hypothetical protein